MTKVEFLSSFYIQNNLKFMFITKKGDFGVFICNFFKNKSKRIYFEQRIYYRRPL